ncbi:MAG: hypothetical protein U1F41_00245 [Burkholderiales bacterium]
MGARRRWTLEALRTAAAGERSLIGVLRTLGLRPAGGNYEQVRRAIRENCVSTSHWTGKGHLKGKRNPHVPKAPLAEMLVKGQLRNTTNLRERLIAERVFEARCSACKQVEWMGHGIPLELDHIDGDRSNNLLANLRLLCPNCHALTPTYRGRNVAAHRAARSQLQLLDEVLPPATS